MAEKLTKLIKRQPNGARHTKIKKKYYKKYNGILVLVEKKKFSDTETLIFPITNAN